MSKKALLCIIAVILTAAFVLAGCGGVSEEDIKESIDNKKASETVKLIKSYAKQDDKDDLDEVVAKEFKDLCKSTEYSDFKYMDSVVAKMKDKELKAKLSEVIKKNGTNKVIAFIEGDWVRRDFTNLDGVVINVKSNKRDSVSVITDVKKSKDKDFKIGDVKWKNIKPMSSNEFVFSDLCKGADKSYYIQGYATIDFDKNQINCKISANKKSYKKGNAQVWIKKDVIAEKKETITKNDFVVNGKKLHLKPDGGRYYYDIKYVDNRKLQKILEKSDDDKTDIMSRGKIGIGKSDRDTVIKSYGYGSILYQSYKHNTLYKNTDGKGPIFKGFISIIKKAEYSAVYFNKNRSRYIEMFFDSKDKLMSVLYFNRKLELE